MFWFFKNKDRDLLKQITMNIQENGLKKASQCFEHQCALVVLETMKNFHNSTFVADRLRDENYIINIEKYFIWGWFRKYAEEFDVLPTKGEHLVFIYMIYYLSNKFQIDYDVALPQARDLLETLNQR